jgi:hypothetical protein
MKKLVGILTLILIFKFQVKAQIFYSETFNGVTAPALPAGWSTTANWATINSTSSTPIPPYSGTNNIIVQNCGPNNEIRRIQTPSFSTIGKTNIILSYGIRRTATFPSGAIVTEYSLNGGAAWTAITIGSAGSTTWSTVFATLPVAVENQASVIIRWTFTSTIGGACSGASANFKIDDVTVAESIILPLSLTKFYAGYEKNKAKLNWETTNEIDFSHFEIEKSTDGKNFETVAVIPSKGNGTNSTEYYEYFDNLTIANEILYYRIKMVDQNRSSKYTSTAKLKIRPSGLSIHSLYPVPAGNEININWNNNATGTTRFKITDFAGRTVLMQTLLTQKGTNFNQIQISKLPSGTYFLIIETDSDKLVERFIKQ